MSSSVSSANPVNQQASQATPQATGNIEKRDAKVINAKSESSFCSTTVKKILAVALIVIAVAVTLFSVLAAIDLICFYVMPAKCFLALAAKIGPIPAIASTVVSL